MEDLERLETAIKRNFVVALQSKAGLRPFTHNAVVVQAYSIFEAKNKAVKKVAKGPFKNRTHRNHWVFLSVEDADAGPSDQSGSAED